MVQIDRQRLVAACDAADGNVRRKRQASDVVFMQADALQPALQDNIDAIQQVSNDACAHNFIKETKKNTSPYVHICFDSHTTCVFFSLCVALVTTKM